MQAIIVVLGMFVIFGFGLGQYVRTATVCFNSDTCGYHGLSCEGSSIFLLKALYGYKPSNMSCSISSCAHSSTCCTSSGGVCFKPYSLVQFSDLYRDCFGKSTCNVRGLQGDVGCTNTTSSIAFATNPSYSHIEYACLNVTSTTTFNSSNVTTGKAVAILYKDESLGNSGSRGLFSCLVDTVQRCSSKTDVMLVKGRKNKGSDDKCSSIGFTETDLLPCNSGSVSYNFTETFTPFYIHLSLNKSGIDNASAVIRAKDDVQLRVTCQSSQGTSGQPEGTTTDPRQPCVRSSTSPPTQPSVSGNSAGAIAAGVVVAILALGAAIIVLFWYIRRVRQGPRQKTITQQKGDNLGHVPIQSLREKATGFSVSGEARTSDYAVISDSAVQPSSPYFQVELDNGPTPQGAPSDVDYDLIGKKKPSTQRQGNTYGHLGEVRVGGEGTDYNYDRLGGGRQAAPDVIDSDYDTSALHVTSEGDYNVAGIPKRNHVITGSDYDVAEVVTSESADGSDVTPMPSIDIEESGATHDLARATITAPECANYHLAKPVTGPEN